MQVGCSVPERSRSCRTIANVRRSFPRRLGLPIFGGQWLSFYPLFLEKEIFDVETSSLFVGIQA